MEKRTKQILIKEKRCIVCLRVSITLKRHLDQGSSSKENEGHWELLRKKERIYTYMTVVTQILFFPYSLFVFLFLF